MNVGSDWARACCVRGDPLGSVSTWEGCRARRSYHTEGEEVVKLPRTMREGAEEDTVCSIVHNIVSRDVTLEKYTHKSQTSLFDNSLQCPVQLIFIKHF